MQLVSGELHSEMPVAAVPWQRTGGVQFGTIDNYFIPETMIKGSYVLPDHDMTTEAYLAGLLFLLSLTAVRWLESWALIEAFMVITTIMWRLMSNHCRCNLCALPRLFCHSWLSHPSQWQLSKFRTFAQLQAHPGVLVWQPSHRLASVMHLKCTGTQISVLK